MQLKLNGKQYSIDKKAVEDALSGIEPGFAGKYFIEVNGIQYPVKQALACCLGIPSIRIQSNHALGILEKAGFEIIMGGQSDGE